MDKLFDGLDTSASLLIIRIQSSNNEAIRWLRRGYQWRRLLATGLIAFAALTAMGRLDGVLARMHEPGAVAGGVTSIATPLVDDNDVDELRRSWDAWDEGNRGVPEGFVDGEEFKASPGIVGGWWLLLDTLVFAPLLAYLLAAYSWRRRRYLLAHSVGASSPAAAAVIRALEMVTVLVVPAYLLIDMVENAITWLLVADLNGRGGLAGDVIGAVSLTKIIVFALAVLGVLLSYVHRPATSNARLRRTQTLLAMRIPLVATAFVSGILLALPSNVRDQLDDLLRSWRESPTHGWAAIVAVSLLSLALAGVSMTLLRQQSGGVVAPGSLQIGVLTVIAAGGLAGLVGSLTVLDGLEPWLLPICIGLLVFALLSAPDSVRSLGSSRPAFAPQRELVTVVSLLPPYALLVAWIHAEIGIGDWTSWRIPGAALAVLAFGALWVVIGRLVGSFPSNPASAARPLVAGLGLVGLALAVGPLLVHDGLDDLASGVGSVALVCWTALALLLVGGAVDLVLPGPRAMLTAMRLRRVPLVTGVLGIAVAATFVDTEPGFHRAETARVARQPGVTITDALLAWDGVCSDYTREPCMADVRPMFLVATAGGGARAAYWTIVAHDCIFRGEAPEAAEARGRKACSGADRRSSIALASGISGGSVGITMSAARFWADGSTIDEREVFEDGFVDPVISNLLFVDLPNSVFHEPSWRDRAGALEAAFERSVPELARELFETQLEAGAVSNFPVLLLNSATVEEGCRMNVSVLTLAEGIAPNESCRTLSSDEGQRVGPLTATRDIERYLCDDRGDLKLSTASLLSARFPIVSPSGALTACDGQTHTFLVDGGYVDSSAAGTISDLLPAIVQTVRGWNEDSTKPCTQPVVLQLDNGYTDIVRRADPERPAELLAPIAGAGAASGGRADSERQRLVSLANDLLADVGCTTAPSAQELPRYLHIYPESHPGTQAPLGWALSEIAKEDLETQLFSANNRCEIARMKEWMSGKPSGSVPHC